MRTRALGIALLAVGATGCGGSAPVARFESPAGARPAGLPSRTTHRFDESTAYKVTKMQVAAGPRPAGSPAQRRVADRLVRMLPGGHFEPLPGGLRNIVGRLPGRQPAIVLAAHYDTTDVPGYVGANNSATGVGAVVSIARTMAREPRPRSAQAVWFLLTDGEEAPVGYRDFYREGLRGSRAFVDAHKADTREAIVLDFIALASESLPREVGSDARLWGRLRTAARRAGVGSMFPQSVANEVVDDHTPFNRAGRPAIDLIDFDYPCWQKTCDTLDKVSRRALANVGEAVLGLLEAERLRR
jgi:glutaminyl-peptide cyclotransferase